MINENLKRARAVMNRACRPSNRRAFSSTVSAIPRRARACAMIQSSSQSAEMLTLLRREAQIPVLWVAGGVLLALGHSWIEATAASALETLSFFGALFVLIIWGAFGVVRHAEELAEKLGEPYGTLILTMSVTIIEVAFIITAMAKSGASSPLARDAVFAVLMIMLNGVVGLCLLLGALKHHEQDYNLPGTRAFLAVAIPLSVFALVLPNFTTSTPGPSLSTTQATAIAILTLTLYSVFLAMQTISHRSSFQDLISESAADGRHAHVTVDNNDGGEGTAHGHSVSFHGVALVITLLPVVYLTELLGTIIDRVVAAAGAPVAVAGVIVAIVVLAPEAMGAVHASLRNRLQRAVNIALGSALATIGLTIPAVLALGVGLGVPVIFGLEREETLLLLTTLVVSMLTFGGVRTNMLQGAVHLVMFGVFVLLLFDP
jgi:Ca2+:H+ antiporter